MLEDAETNVKVLLKITIFYRFHKRQSTFTGPCNCFTSHGQWTWIFHI